MAKQARKKKEGQHTSELEGLPPWNRNAAGIDLASAAHSVAVPPDRCCHSGKAGGSPVLV